MMSEEQEQQMVEHEYPVEAGALREAPIWEEHQRGKNWLAKIDLDPKKPGGLARQFFKKAGGEYYYLVEEIERGDALEFAADYFSGGGRRSVNRLYAAVVSATESSLALREFETSREAVEEAKRIRAEAVEADDLSEDEREMVRRLAEMPDSRVIAIFEARRKLVDGEN